MQESSFGLSRSSTFLAAIYATTNLANFLCHERLDFWLNERSRTRDILMVLNALQFTAAWICQLVLYASLHSHYIRYPDLASFVLCEWYAPDPNPYWRYLSSASLAIAIVGLVSLRRKHRLSDLLTTQSAVWVILFPTSSCVYIPQLYLTRALRQLGGLSLTSLGMQLMTLFLWSVSSIFNVQQPLCCRALGPACGCGSLPGCAAAAGCQIRRKSGGGSAIASSCVLGCA